MILLIQHFEIINENKDVYVKDDSLQGKHLKGKMNTYLKKRRQYIVSKL